ncbi:MAG: hypothetical protein RLY43_1528, partial [Bacteroidota bacterium]
MYLNKILIYIFIFFLTPLSAFAATLSINPSNGSYQVGDRFIVNVVVSSNQAVNAVSGVINVPSIFTIESVSKSSSILNFWVTEPSFNQGTGSVNFEGVSLGGFSGGSGNVITLSLKANKEGSGAIKFNSGQILANDGQGTDITTGFGSSNFSVQPRVEAVPEPVVETTEEKVEKAPAKTKSEPAPEIEEDLELPQPPPTLKSPQISIIEKSNNKYVSGISDYKDNQVLITFISEEGIKIFIQNKTDGDGKFFVPVPTTLKRGIYEVFAVIIKDDLTYTEQSNTVKMSIGNMFSDISTELKSILIVIIIIVLALI